MTVIKTGGAVIVCVILFCVFLDWYGDMRESRGYKRGEFDGYMCGVKEGVKRGLRKARERV